MKKKIGVVTPTGNVGRNTVERLLQLDADVILIGRSNQQESLKEAIQAGAEFRIASHDDQMALVEATRGVSSFMWLTPPNMNSDMETWYVETAQNAARAIQQNGIERVVHVSAVGAGTKEGLGTVSYIGKTEEILNKVSSNIVHLRPGYFMENLLLQKNNLEAGKLLLPFAPDHDVPWISAIDIGRFAANYLHDRSWAGQWQRNLLGPENLNGIELATRLSRILRRNIEYVQQSFDEVRQSLKLAGLNPAAIQELILLYRALGDNDGVYATPRTSESITPTTLSQALESYF